MKKQLEMREPRIEASFNPPSEDEASAALGDLCSVTGSRASAIEAVATLTRVALGRRQAPYSSAPLLVPILRAGAAMWLPACEWFPDAPSGFMVAKKLKGSTTVKVEASTLPCPMPPSILVLDPIIATGDTIVAVVELLRDIDASAVIEVVSCYAAPQALERLARHPFITSVTAAAVADYCDDKGYLVPPIGGDCGEKLFGRRDPLVA